MLSARTTVLLVLFFSSCAELGYAGIIVIPQDFTVKFDQNGHPSNNLTVVCKPPTSNNIQGITFMQVRKHRKNEELGTPMATISPQLNGGFPVKEAGLTNRKYDLSGSISAADPTESFMRLELQDASCVDEGHFECHVHLYREGASDTEVLYDAAAVQTKTLPEQVLLLQRPSYDSFLVNQTVEFYCTAQVGSPPAYYRWQYRKGESDVRDVTFGATHSEGPYPQGFCKYFRTSTLWVRATLELNGVEIRCVLTRGLTQYTNISASFILIVKEAGCVPSCWNGGVCEGTTCWCPPYYSGAFCEQPLDKPCEENCNEDTSAGFTIYFADAFKLTVMMWMLIFSVL